MPSHWVWVSRLGIRSPVTMRGRQALLGGPPASGMLVEKRANATEHLPCTMSDRQVTAYALPGNGSHLWVSMLFTKMQMLSWDCTAAQSSSSYVTSDNF